MSLDGKIADASRGRPTFTSPADRERMDRIRARADAILVGAGTLRATDTPLKIRSAARRARRRRAGRPEQPLNILLSRALRVRIPGRFFADPEVPRLVVTVRAEQSDARLARIGDRATSLRLTGSRVDPRRLVRELYRRGIRELLLEGGGATNFEFFRLGLIDEIYLTLCPVILGGARSPTPADGDGFPPGRFAGFRLRSLDRVGSELFLHYTRAPDGGRDSVRP